MCHTSGKSVRSCYVFWQLQVTRENDDVSMLIVLRLVYGSYKWQICTQLLRFLAAEGYYRK